MVALGVAGALAVVLLIGRVLALLPAYDADVDFARRALVVHVNHSVVVWFFAFLAGLFLLLPSPRSSARAPLALTLASSGVALFTLLTFGQQLPVLSNYVPVLDHSLFLLGLGAFAAGVALTFLDRARLFGGAPTTHAVHDAGPHDTSSWLQPSARDAVRGAAIAYLCALATVAVAALTQERSLPAAEYYERLFWGGGHILQIACVLAMLAVWDVLLRELTGHGALSRRWNLVLCALLLLPALAAPGIVLMRRSEVLFTRMMQWGIFPMVSVVLIGAMRTLWRARATLRTRMRTPAFTALSTSMIMTIAGFVVGAMIVRDTTLVPAHYHLSIGAVTVSFMGMLFVTMPRLGWPLSMSRAALWQPLVYGIGQAVFAGGLATAGFWGQAARKVYGREQVVDQFSQTLGFATAGVGGLAALIAGVLFVVVIVRGALAGRAAERALADQHG